ncbi:hypothetical protein CNMCM7691_005512 [Aspergillus felis]|uniref:NACHT domain-containing protein n=1 Tax=Aspergillus felis TaxID=1287682 RepID=A0A8H6QLH8_9EURO|nr:hypothetical protein CNMCM7691_005512 [Aspergillus felis]
MPAISDFPRFPLCEACCCLLTDYKDEQPVRFPIWYEQDGYGYTRLRRDLERAAVLGCVFCKSVAARDRKYQQDQKDDGNAEKLSFDPRPSWYPPLDEVLELRIRYNSVENVLWIWSTAGVRWSGGDLSWSLFTTPEDPAASVVHVHTVLRDLGSEQSFNEAREWMQECLHTHAGCPSDERVDLPRRLIYVSPLGEPREFARICETGGQQGQYCALSYCWGGDQMYKTVRDCYEQYKKGLPYHSLPQTIQDALHVTRSMGLQYIWIDSMCIIQDDEEDKQREMGKMMDIYQNTLFTISAASAAAASEGFLRTDLHDSRNEVWYHPLRVDEQTMGAVLVSHSSTSFESLGARPQPINTRGWTLQETILTSRLLIFAGIHMIWKCQSGFLPDVPARARDRYGKSPWDFWFTLCDYTVVSLQELDGASTPDGPQTGKRFNIPDIYREWRKIAQKYASKGLTEERDRLPAISAVAQKFAARFKTEYYAGLWGKFLVYDLMWANWLGQSESSTRRPGPPSWSWAKLKGEHSYESGVAQAEVISCTTTPVSENNPFGEVSGGELVIRGPLGPTWLHTDSGTLTNDDGIIMPRTDYTSDRGHRDRIQGFLMTEPKPDNGGALSAADSGKQGISVETVEKSSPTQSHPSARDLWQDALKQLPEAKQEKLKCMGFGQLNSGSVEASIYDLMGEVNKKQEQCEQKFWRVSVGDHDFVLRNYTTKIVGWLQKAGDIAVQFAPPQASVPWTVLKSVMQIPVIDGEQMAALLAVTEKVVRIVSRGQVYEQVYLIDTSGTSEDKLSKSLQDALVKIYSTSLELLADSADLFSTNTARRTLKAILNPGHVSGGLSALAEQEDELLRDVQACESRRSAQADDRMIGMLDRLNAPLTRVDENVQSLLGQISQSHRTVLLEWISPIKFGEHHYNVKEKRTPGTGEWLLQNERFRDWEKTSSSGIFWLQGSPGTGKTYLTSRVVDLVQGMLNDLPKDEGFAFFYCDKTEPNRGQAQSIFQSYVRQLSTPASNPESIQTQLKETCQKAQDAGSTLRFDACKKQILESLNLYSKTTLVLDALDECDPESREELIDALKSLLLESKNTVKVFISSRPDPDIQSQLDGCTSVSIQASDNQTDIQNFLEKELEKLARTTACIRRLKTTIVDKLLARCQGMFQWAALQIHQIRTCKTENSVLKRLDTLPDGLQEAYNEVWSEIEKLEEPDQSLTKRALLWVMSACMPMTSDELLCAIRVKPTRELLLLDDEIDEQGLLSLCRNLLVIDSQLSVWRFAHLSVREYIENKVKWTIERAHFHAARVSLLVLNDTFEKIDPDAVSDPSDRSTEHDNFSDLSHPFQLYIRHHWPLHVQGVRDPEQVMLAPLLKTFLGSPEDSSLQYRRWYRQIIVDGILLPSTSVFLRDLWSVEEIAPENFAIFAMCYFSLDTILWDWWEGTEIPLSLVNERCHNLLAIAAMAGSKPICKNLVERGLQVDLQLPSSEYGSALAAAARMGQLETVKFLVKEAGANVNMPLQPPAGQFGSALAIAAFWGQIEVIKYLVKEAGADVNLPFTPRSPGWDAFSSALEAAAYTSRDDVVKFLVQEAGADLNVQLPSGKYGSALAAAQNGDIEIVKFLVQEAGANVNALLQSGEYGSALAAASMRDIEIVKFLVQEAGADVNQQLTSGYYGSALAAAAQNEDIDIVKFLVQEAGADVNMPLKSGYCGSALAAAAAIGNLTAVRYLIEAKADVNQCLPNGKYGSALAAASALGRKDCAELLIEAGAEVNLRLEGVPFNNALQAAQATVSKEDLMWLEIYETLDEESLRQHKDEVAELLQYHGATV